MGSVSIIEVLRECEDYFDSRSDADHDGTGFVPNEEMKLLALARDAIKAEGRANARLFAAAPDLLHVAELVVSWLDEEEGAHALCDKARAAIAKAVGK